MYIEKKNLTVPGKKKKRKREMERCKGFFCFCFCFCLAIKPRWSKQEMTDIIANEILGFIKISRVQAKKRRQRRKKFTTYGTIQISTESFYPVLPKLKLKKRVLTNLTLELEKKQTKEVKKMIWYNQPGDEI